MPEPRIALFDIETAPSLGYFFDLWKEGNIIDTKADWYMLSFAYKWLGDKGIQVHALCDYPGYERNRECDKRLMRDLWHVFDTADIVIAHNGDRFDIRKANARFIVHGLRPPSPYKSVDTLKIARSKFKFDSNRLDSLGGYLGVGRKLPNTGKHLWLGCMAGDRKAWTMMKKYNVQDVALLERVYTKLRPWTTSHPNLTHYSRDDACPICQSPQVIKTGFAYLASGQRQRMTCHDCGHRFVSGKIIRV